MQSWHGRITTSAKSSFIVICSFSCTVAWHIEVFPAANTFVCFSCCWHCVHCIVRQFEFWKQLLVIASCGCVRVLLDNLLGAKSHNLPNLYIYFYIIQIFCITSLWVWVNVIRFVIIGPFGNSHLPSKKCYIIFAILKNARKWKNL